MDNKIKTTLAASLNRFATAEGLAPGNLENELTAAFSGEEGFLEKTAKFDAVMDEYPRFEALREVFFDLLMVNFFASDVQKLEDDYLESDEWAAIEEETIDRGTELLNLLLYIRECQDEGIDPELDDFLKEFLLVEDDEFQDEFAIYESLISNQELAETNIRQICEASARVDKGEELEDLFVPFLAFFHNPRGGEETLGELAAHSGNKGFETAVYALLTTYNR
ncbi:hypothetical protein C7T94_18160 [Pedobacter yulinensis]|uniref:Uncharacterized protein n=1 Tax=Pedobacter yulinensis TaxID=2126353 RepID=A0A2T3HH78_9SPHI|nr:hypothetical protein [Pedobacter yulinensis]PST81794.1 hypothetical protein C7T94_18160 [Pedobacter yulinensis]